MDSGILIERARDIGSRGKLRAGLAFGFLGDREQLFGALFWKITASGRKAGVGGHVVEAQEMG